MISLLSVSQWHLRYSVAVAAKFHGIPFHAVAPVSTVDIECKDGSHIEIEQRSPMEVQVSNLDFARRLWSSNIFFFVLTEGSQWLVWAGTLGASTSSCV